MNLSSSAYHVKILIMSCRVFQVVQEYERAVMFRLGRLLQGGARGPGNDFTHIPPTLGI